QRPIAAADLQGALRRELRLPAQGQHVPGLADGAQRAPALALQGTARIAGIGLFVEARQRVGHGDDYRAPDVEEENWEWGGARLAGLRPVARPFDGVPAPGPHHPAGAGGG